MEQAQERVGRYDYSLDPCDLYVIWDKIADAPCMADGGPLAFATEAGAIEAVTLLNRYGAIGGDCRTSYRALLSITDGAA